MVFKLLVIFAAAASFSLPASDQWEWQTDDVTVTQQDAESQLAAEAFTSGKQVCSTDLCAAPADSTGEIVVRRRGEELEGAPDTFTAFRLEKGMVVARSAPLFRAPVPAEREEFAREVAFRSATSNVPSLPSTFNGRMYVPVRESQCRMKVIEKDRERQYAAYSFNVCSP